MGDATDARVETAARAVGAHDSMSGGQRQFVALARALLGDPVVLLLDEATANLDLATDARVARAMGLVSSGRTTILIAHRLQTAARADRILVIDDGNVIETAPTTNSSRREPDTRRSGTHGKPATPTPAW